MALRQYELTFILPPSLAEDEINEIEERVTNWITGKQGNIIKTSHWGRMKMAYPIQSYKEGYYILMEFVGEAAEIQDLNRRIRLDDNIIRHLFVRVEEDEPGQPEQG